MNREEEEKITVCRCSDVTLKEIREDYEKKYIISSLKKHDGNISATAKELDIERTNLHRKIKQYKINVDKL